jgi:hypothetical protein
MVCPADSACLTSNTVESFAPTAVVTANGTSARVSVKVPAVPAELVTTMLVTTAVVLEGTVYKVVVVVVVAAPRNSALAVVGIRELPSELQFQYLEQNLN